MNYKIEGDVDFYKELKKSIQNDTSTDENICKITYEPLSDNFITLTCKHKFNYIPLYNEVVSQKVKTSYLETHRLRTKQIKCPYCRTITNALLPFIPFLQ